MKWIIGYLSLILTLSGCGYPSVCAKLDRSSCSTTPPVPCGCYDLVKLNGGVEGGEYDPRDQGLHEAIIIRNDSTVEFYRNDTLYWRSSFQVVQREAFKQGKLSTVLVLTGHFEPQGYTLAVEDPDHLWYSMENAVDNFHSLYRRYR